MLRLGASLARAPRRWCHHAPSSFRPAPACSAFALVEDPRQLGVDGSTGTKSVATRRVRAGEVLFQEGGPFTSSPGMHTLMVGIGTHMEVTGDGRWTAHSFDPNCFVRVVDFSSHPIDLVALRDIEEGEAFSIDYTICEWVMGAPFVDEATGRDVRGFKHRSEEEKLRLLGAGLLPAHILRLWLTELHAVPPGHEFPRFMGTDGPA